MKRSYYFFIVFCLSCTNQYKNFFAKPIKTSIIESNLKIKIEGSYLASIEEKNDLKARKLQQEAPN